VAQKKTNKPVVKTVISIKNIQKDWKAKVFSARQIAVRNNCSETTAYKYRPDVKLSVSKLPKPAPKPAVRKTNLVTFLIDESGSMDHLRGSLPKVFQDTAVDMDQSALTMKAVGIDQSYSILRFGRPPYTNVRNKLEGFSGVASIDENVKATDFEQTLSNYTPYGNTELFRSVNTAVERSGAADTRLIIVLTDGEDNASGYQQTETFRRTMNACPANLTVAFLVPNVQSINRLVAFGVPVGNIKVWDTTSVKGLEAASHVTQSAFRSHTKTLSSGATGSNNYFGVGLGDVKVGDAKKELDEITGHRVLFTQRDRVIRDFVEAETKQPYVVGNSYYELVKTESVVHNSKKMAIRDPSTGKVFGGSSARAKLSIPEGRIKMKPGEHGRWQVFIQSTSVNRNIPANTSVLVLNVK
jgi:hypothetical protein